MELDIEPRFKGWYNYSYVAPFAHVGFVDMWGMIKIAVERTISATILESIWGHKISVQTPTSVSNQI